MVDIVENSNTKDTMDTEDVHGREVPITEGTPSDLCYILRKGRYGIFIKYIR